MPTSVKFREAYARGVPLIIYDPHCTGTLAYHEAAAAFLRDQASASRGAGQPVNAYIHRAKVQRFQMAREVER